MNKLQKLAVGEIEIYARTAEELLHKVARERQFVDAICRRNTVENEIFVLLGKIISTADAIGESI